MEHHILSAGPLLKDDGNVSEAGFSTELIKIYSRDQVKTSKLRIKEWDYYYVGNKDYGLAVTIADNSYMSLIGATFFDFKNKIEYTKNIMGFMSKGKFKMPTDSRAGDIVVENKNASFKFIHEDDKRHLMVTFKNFVDKKDFRCDVYLEETCPDTMVIVTPFRKKKHFYYNQKINCMKASGYMKLGQKEVDFLEDSYGVLDWGRGVWTYRNTWYWSSMNGSYRGKNIGWNLGYGFGDTSKASENVFYYDNKQYKLDDVKFDIPLNKKGKFDYMRPWKVRSSKGDISVTFTPVLDRVSNTNALVIKQVGHQVFGTFTGEIMVEDKIIHFEDVPGFAERITNWW